MRPSRWLACALVAISVAAPSSACAGWSLWPFGKQDEDDAPTRSRPMTASADFWKADLEASSDEPSVLTRMSNGTQRFVRSTKQALSFGKSKKPSTVNRLGSSSKKKKPKAESAPWFPTAEPEAPKTMKEWWDLKRVDPL